MQHSDFMVYSFYIRFYITWMFFTKIYSVHYRGHVCSVRVEDNNQGFFYYNGTMPVCWYAQQGSLCNQMRKHTLKLLQTYVVVTGSKRVIKYACVLHQRIGTSAFWMTFGINNFKDHIRVAITQHNEPSQTRIRCYNTCCQNIFMASGFGQILQNIIRICHTHTWRILACYKTIIFD